MNTAESSLLLDSSDIAKILSSSGPVVKCVLLKAPPPSTDDDGTSKPAPTTSLPSDKDVHGHHNDSPTDDANNQSNQSSASRVVLKDLMEEIEIDTTPSKSMVSQVLGGGPFTFLGQYEDEGIVLMISKLPVDLLDREELMDLKASELRHLCHEREIPFEKQPMLEKSDLIDSLLAWSHRSHPPLNSHILQPPLHKERRIRGDILVMKVAETKEELDQENPTSPVVVPTNEEFFLDYTLEEYIKFASRTDIPEYNLEADDDDEAEEGDEEEGEHDEDDVDNSGSEEDGEEDDDHHPQEEVEVDGDDEEGVPLRFGDDVEIDDEDRAAMFNLVMNEVLRQYREENGRGPDTKELLEIRASIAKELDVPVAHIDADQADWNKHAKDGTPAKENAKTIAFHTEDKVLEYQPDPNEHNYDDLEHEQGFDHQHLDDDDDDDDDDEDDDYASARPPRKRRRIVHGSEEEDDDSKPAATATKKAHDTSAEELDQNAYLGDKASGIIGSTDKSTEKR